MGEGRTQSGVRSSRTKETTMPIDYDLLKRLSETPGVPSREEQIRHVVMEALSPLVDEIAVDPMGNVVGRKRGSGGQSGDGAPGPGGSVRRVMIAGTWTRSASWCACG